MPEEQRVIFHCDCNSFYASVELLRYPELRGVPVAVCGSPDDRHGIVLAKNEPAKRYGVQTAETVWSALRKCPGLKLLPPHHGQYREMSRAVNAIYARYTDRIELFGIDESWLDMTQTWRLFGSSPAGVADAVRRAVKAETGLTISVGVSFNKVFAKLGSDYKKPDAVTVIDTENFRRIVWPLPVNTLLYVGRSAQNTLAGLGVRNIGQLAAAKDEDLRAALGKLGPELGAYARGEENSPVRTADERPEIKSVGNGLTFKRNLVGEADVRAGLYALADEGHPPARPRPLRCCRAGAHQKPGPEKHLPPEAAALALPSGARDRRGGPGAGKSQLEPRRAHPHAHGYGAEPDGRTRGTPALTAGAGASPERKTAWTPSAENTARPPSPRATSSKTILAWRTLKLKKNRDMLLKTNAARAACNNYTKRRNEKWLNIS